MGGGRGAPRGLLTLPALPFKLVCSPQLALLSALRGSDANWLGSYFSSLSPHPPLRFLLPFPPLPVLPSSSQCLPPSLLSPLVIKENSSWPDQTSNAVPRPPAPSP